VLLEAGIVQHSVIGPTSMFDIHLHEITYVDMFSSMLQLPVMFEIC
jgi:hypothetical protein